MLKIILKIFYILLINFDIIINNFINFYRFIKNIIINIVLDFFKSFLEKIRNILDIIFCIFFGWKKVIFYCFYLCESFR